MKKAHDLWELNDNDVVIYETHKLGAGAFATVYMVAKLMFSLNIVNQ